MWRISARVLVLALAAASLLGPGTLTLGEEAPARPRALTVADVFQYPDDLRAAGATGWGPLERARAVNWLAQRPLAGKRLRIPALLADVQVPPSDDADADLTLHAAALAWGNFNPPISGAGYYYDHPGGVLVLASPQPSAAALAMVFPMVVTLHSVSLERVSMDRARELLNLAPSQQDRYTPVWLEVTVERSQPFGAADEIINQLARMAADSAHQEDPGTVPALPANKPALAVWASSIRVAYAGPVGERIGDHVLSEIRAQVEAGGEDLAWTAAKRFEEAAEIARHRTAIAEVLAELRQRARPAFEAMRARSQDASRSFRERIAVVEEYLAGTPRPFHVEAVSVRADLERAARASDDEAFGAARTLAQDERLPLKSRASALRSYLARTDASWHAEEAKAQLEVVLGLARAEDDETFARLIEGVESPRTPLARRVDLLRAYLDADALKWHEEDVRERLSPLDAELRFVSHKGTLRGIEQPGWWIERAAEAYAGMLPGIWERRSTLATCCWLWMRSGRSDLARARLDALGDPVEHAEAARLLALRLAVDGNAPAARDVYRHAVESVEGMFDLNARRPVLQRLHAVAPAFEEAKTLQGIGDFEAVFRVTLKWRNLDGADALLAAEHARRRAEILDDRRQGSERDRKIWDRQNQRKLAGVEEWRESRERSLANRRREGTWRAELERQGIGERELAYWPELMRVDERPTRRGAPDSPLDRAPSLIRAILAARAGRLDEAEEALRRESDPRHGWSVLFAEAIRRGDREREQKVLEHVPNRVDALEAAEAYLHAGRLEEARAWLFDRGLHDSNAGAGRGGRSPRREGATSPLERRWALVVVELIRARGRTAGRGAAEEWLDAIEPRLRAVRSALGETLALYADLELHDRLQGLVAAWLDGPMDRATLAALVPHADRRRLAWRIRQIGDPEERGERHALVAMVLSGLDPSLSGYRPRHAVLEADYFDFNRLNDPP